MLDAVAKHRTLASSLQAQLRADILACSIAPGDKLLVASLAQRFGTSTAVVREALSRLVAQGLVAAEDQKGFHAAPVSVRDLLDLTETRVEVECLALRRSIDRGGPAWRAAVEGTHDTLAATPRTDPADPTRHNAAWPARHEAFHAALVGGCGLERLLRWRAGLFEQSERYRRLALLDQPPRGRDVAGEHRILIEAALARDADAACRAMRSHLEATAQAVLRATQGLQEGGLRERGQRQAWAG